VTAAPSLEIVAATLRAFVARAGALRAVALLDRGEAAPPAVVDCDGAGTCEVEEAGAVRVLPVTAADPLPLPDVRALPPMDVDSTRGEVIGTIGGLQHLAEAVGGLAAALGGRSVATVQFETTAPDMPLGVSARRGEPAVLALGDEPFALS
jgi:hypothetical protein